MQQKSGRFVARTGSVRAPQDAAPSGRRPQGRPRRTTSAPCVAVVVERLEERSLLSTSLATGPAFVVTGAGRNPFGGPDVAKVVRVDGTSGAPTVIREFTPPGGLGVAGNTPLLTQINDVVLSPAGDLIVVGRGDDVSTFGTTDIVKLFRVNPTTSAVTFLTQFAPTGTQLAQFPPLLESVAGIATAPDGSIFVTGIGPTDPAGLNTTSGVKVFRIDPASGAPTEIVRFVGPGNFNQQPVLASVADIAVAPDGNLIVAGLGVINFGDPVVKVLGVNATTGALSGIAQFPNEQLNVLPLLSTVASVALDATGRVLLAGTGDDPLVGGNNQIVKVVRIDTATGTPVALSQFRHNGSPTEIDAVTGIAFAPIQGAIGVVGVRQLGQVGGLVNVQAARLVRINQTTGAQTLTTQFILPGTNTPALTTTAGITAGLIEVGAAPVTSVSGPKKGVAGGGSLAFVLKAVVPRVARPADGLYTYDVDWDGDGTTDESFTGARKLRVRHDFSTAGTFVVSATGTGRDGAVGPVGVHALTIAAPAR
jgi:hypothetical protein